MAFTRKVLAVIGPSGAGKSTVIRNLHDEGLVQVSPTWTTRPPRPGELEETVEHHFVAEAEFAKKQKIGFFVEVVQMFDLPFKYGLSPISEPEPGKVPVVMLRASLLQLFNKYYPNNVVYQIEDDLPKIRERLRARELHGEELGSRLSDYEKEIAFGHKLADRIFINRDLGTLADQIKKALKEDFPE
jgi:guanylate kinase